MYKVTYDDRAMNPTIAHFDTEYEARKLIANCLANYILNKRYTVQFFDDSMACVIDDKGMMMHFILEKCED